MTPRQAGLALGVGLLLAACSEAPAAALAPSSPPSRPVSATASSSPVTQAPATSAEGSVTPAPRASAAASASAATSAAALTQRDEPALPEAREEGAAAVADGKLYVMAGFDKDGHDTSSVFVFDGRSWLAGPALPVVLDHPSGATLDSDVYVAGGFSNGPAGSGAYRLNAGRWQAVAPLAHARGGLALVALNGKLYAIGGIADKEVAPAEVYDPAANRWTELAPLQAARDHVAGFAYLGKACIAGGRTPNSPRVDCFDPAANSWQRLPDLPQPTSGAGAETLNGAPLVVGGEGDRIIDQFAVLRGGAWQLDKMRQPRHGLQLAVLNGRAYACGGGTAPGLNAVASCTSVG